MPNLRLAGVVSLSIDGDAWDVVGDCAYGPSTVVRETLKGQSRVEGFSEMPQQGYVAATLRIRSDVTVFSLNGKTSTTLVVQLANGVTVFGANMWQVGEIEVRTQEGGFAIRFEGDSVTEN